MDASNPAKLDRVHGEGRSALMVATVQVVAEKGLRGLTFRAVAEHAGVNNTLIVHHFGTRDALLAETLDWSVHASILVSKLDGSTSREDYRDALLGTLLNEPELQVFQFEMILESSRRAELRPAVARLYRTYIAALAGSGAAFGALGVDDALDRAMFGALDGLVLQYLSRTISSDELAASIVALGDVVAAGQAALQHGLPVP